MTDDEDTSIVHPKVKFHELYRTARKLGLSHKDIANLPALKELRTNQDSRLLKGLWQICKYCIIFICTVCIVWALEWPVGNDKLATLWLRFCGVRKDEIPLERCLIRTPDKIMDAFRPPIDCRFCQNVSSVDFVEKILPEEFEDIYAYSGRPVVITDGAKNWTAMETFSFDFLKEIYSEGSAALKNAETKCQFFPYKTEFKRLGEVFRMEPERARLAGDARPWYIGWSNCDATAGNLLRHHYERPYFLPPASGSSKTDWIFMGSPGYGAHMHLDNVHLPSWQAQIVGTKRWTLEPPSECYSQCVASMQVDVQPGHIIVLDTNKWFHSTLNIGREISITIGSEYD